jgi:hypothetical protein
MSAELMERITSMALSVIGKPIGDWPAWSTGEMLLVAVVLNDHQTLDSLSFTMVEAFERCSWELGAAELRAIERRVQAR